MKYDSPYPSIHSAFKKEFKRLRDSIRSTNRYDLKKICGKTDIFEGKSNDDGDESEKESGKGKPKYTSSKIEGCELTRVKEDKASFAIGDSDGRPITPFDFIFVSKEVSGEKNKIVEVITKDGDARYFNISKMKLDECMGVGAIGSAAAAAPAASAPAATPSGSSTGVTTGGGSGAEIQYDDVKSEMLIPIKGKVPLLYGGAKGGKRKRKNGKIY